MQFKITNNLKPLLFALQASYKDHCYYWIALHTIMKNLTLALYVFQAKPRQILITISLLLFTGYHGFINPYKNRLLNIQELLLSTNLIILFSVSYNSTGNIFNIITNTMFSLVVVQFCATVLYHFLTHTCHNTIVTFLEAMKRNLIS